MRRHAVAACAMLGLLAAPLVSGAAPEPAKALALTTYDDGWSCPADCDAHVVFHRGHNGTRNAFAPGPDPDPLATRAHASEHPCVNGKPCVVCFAEEPTSCIVAVYRGGGPPPNRVDATPAFMKDQCARSGLPAAVVAACTQHARNVASLTRDRISCIQNAERPECHARIAAAQAARAADEPELARCRQLGVAAYNHQQPDPALHRSPAAGCAYLVNQRKSNSHGDSWMMLSPAACRRDTYVGPNGTDCCSGDAFQAAVDVAECRWFYPEGS